MTTINPGRRRVDRVLSPRFIQDVAELSGEDLITRRDDAVQEEADVSYIRRLLQGRLDILRFERRRRSNLADGVDMDHDDAALVRALTSALTDKTPLRPRATQQASAVVSSPSTTTDSAIKVTPYPQPQMVDPRVPTVSRRAAEAAVADVRFSNLAALSDTEIEEAINHLSGLESQVSETRTKLQHVADILIAEVESRVSSGSLGTEVL